METAVVFGEYDHLVGIWTEPTTGEVREHAVIIVTAGMLPSAGPYRLHRDLASRLAKCSIGTMRFDLSGIGESFGVGVAGESTARATDEIRQAMDWVENTHGIHSFVLMGLCSGADDALRAAMTDSRIRGLVSMDGLGYRTPKYYLHRITKHYSKRLLRPSKWVSLIRRLFAKQADAEIPNSLRVGTDIREYPDRDDAARMLEQLADRGTKMHFIYTGGVGEYYNHAGQFHDMFPGLKDRPEISTQYFESMDHVAYLCEDRELVSSHIASVCSAQY